MKKLLLFLSAVAVSGIASAQLTGSSYTQNFNNIDDGTLPTGWSVYTDASTTQLGTQKQLMKSSKGTKYPWTNVAGGFKNLASANNHSTKIDSATQWASTDRALAVRQVSGNNTNFPASDPGASFTFRIGETKNISALNLEFQLQSLDDTSHRQTTWIVDYGIGNTPTTFTAIATTPATLTTGGDTYTNNKVTATLPAAIENSSTPVYIRIWAKDATSGAGNRATTAIDDFKLTWTGTATSDVANIAIHENLPLTVLGNASNSQVTIGYDVKKAGNYKISIYDMTGREVYNTAITAQAGNQRYTINNINLHSGIYVIKMAGNEAVGIVKAAIN